MRHKIALISYNTEAARVLNVHGFPSANKLNNNKEKLSCQYDINILVFFLLYPTNILSLFFIALFILINITFHLFLHYTIAVIMEISLIFTVGLMKAFYSILFKMLLQSTPSRGPSIKTQTGCPNERDYSAAALEGEEM